MAASIFTIFDDIAALMDDVAVATKIATQKTAGILGDDLAVNAEKATGFLSSRELPVLWSITKGSLLNKVIIIPIIFLLQWALPIAITLILIIGGFYLAYEGVEKIVHYFTHKKEHKSAVEKIENLSNEEVLTQEKTKVKSAIFTDFILSLEIVIIALSTVFNESFQIQIITVSIVALLATVGVYGIVALIVRMDDTGFKIIRRSGNKGFGAKVGKMLVNGLPIVIKSLTIVGTVALLLVSGGIFSHNIDFVHHLFPTWPSMLKEMTLGIIAGLAVVIIVSGLKKIFVRKAL